MSEKRDTPCRTYYLDLKLAIIRFFAVLKPGFDYTLKVSLCFVAQRTFCIPWQEAGQSVPPL